MRVALDARERPLHRHHQEIIVVDCELAFVGGIDLDRRGVNPLRRRARRRLCGLLRPLPLGRSRGA
jgi:hypothetical protein